MQAAATPDSVLLGVRGDGSQAGSTDSSTQLGVFVLDLIGQLFAAGHTLNRKLLARD